MNKNTLNAAVRKYGPLHTEGKTEAEVKAEINKDEKGFDDESVNEIYAAIVEQTKPKEHGPDKDKDQKGPEVKPEPPKDEKGKHIVTKEFRDKKDFSKAYTVGSDVSHLSKERIEHLVSIGYVELK